MGVPADEDRVRKLIRMIRDEFQVEFDQFLSVRTVERYLAGRNVRWSSVLAMGKAIGLRRGTMSFVRDGEWERVLLLDNEPLIQDMIGAIRDQEEAAGRNPKQSPSLPTVRRNRGSRA